MPVCYNIDCRTGKFIDTRGLGGLCLSLLHILPLTPRSPLPFHLTSRAQEKWPVQLQPHDAHHASTVNVETCRIPRLIRSFILPRLSYSYFALLIFFLLDVAFFTVIQECSVCRQLRLRLAECAREAYDVEVSPLPPLKG